MTTYTYIHIHAYIHAQVWASLNTSCCSVLEAIKDHRYIIRVQLTTIMVLTLPLTIACVYAGHTSLLGLIFAMTAGQAVASLQAFFRIRSLNWSQQVCVRVCAFIYVYV